MTSRRPPGPIEDHDLPATIEARVVTPGSNSRLHGYGVEDDLALHYRFHELVLLALTGAPPDEARGRAFEVALQFLAPLAITEAPTHAAVLAQVCGARSSSVIAVAGIALAERARYVVAEYGELFHWLGKGAAQLPERCNGASDDDRACVERLQRALARAGVCDVPGLALGPNRWTAIFMTLYFAGLRRPDQWEAALVLASLAPVLAEAQSHRSGSFEQYPMDLPAFVYEENR
jgi:hypothetical protein